MKDLQAELLEVSGKEKAAGGFTLPSPSPPASAEIIRRDWAFGWRKLLSTIAEQNNKEDARETKARDPHGAWVSASCHGVFLRGFT